MHSFDMRARPSHVMSPRRAPGKRGDPKREEEQIHVPIIPSLATHPPPYFLLPFTFFLPSPDKIDYHFFFGLLSSLSFKPSSLSFDLTAGIKYKEEEEEEGVDGAVTTKLAVV